MSKVKILFLTDVHFGNKRVPAAYIKEDIEKHVIPQLDDSIDLFLLGGDFFDALLSLDNEAGWTALYVIDMLLMKAQQHQFLIRVLQGTYTHDRKQNRTFVSRVPRVLGTTDHDLVKCVYSLDIEHIDLLDIDVMYIPGDLPYKNCYERAKELLVSHGLKKVDVIVHHGFMDHLLPKIDAISRANVLTEQQFLDLTSGVVLSGHYHTPSVHNRLISGGSFTRFCHGEEEPKGFFIVTLDTNTHGLHPEFIENKSAPPFITIDITQCGNDLDKAKTMYSDRVASLLSEYPERNIYVRIITTDIAIKHALRSYTESAFDRVVLTVDKSNKSIQETEVLLPMDGVEFPVVTEDMLPSIIYDNLGGKVALDTIKKTIALN
jgi:DNA repair exonuclease SbcCD nuclease subunit